MKTILDLPACDDRRLVALHLSGDPSAFREMVERYQGMVCALAYSGCGDVARSEDIAQEVFLAAWKQLPQLREPEKLRAWLAGITRLQTANASRAERRVPTARAERLPMDAAVDDESPREQAVHADRTELMWRALAAIPETYREPMVLFYREQRSAGAVAAALGISEEAVRQRLVRGRELLTARMAALVEETLERSGPKAAFANAVILSLPLGVAPAVILAEAGAAGGAKVAGGGTVANYAGAGALAGAAAKGGLAVKIVALVALLPALLNGAEDFFRFRVQQGKIGEAARSRRAAWAYLGMHVSLGVAAGIIFVVTEFLERDSLPALWGAWIVAFVAAVWVAGRAKCRLNRELPDEEIFGGKAEASTAPGFDFRSGREFLGLPWVQVRLGSRRGWTLPAVRAWIAVSDGRSVGGIFAIGVVAVAPVSLGILSAGVLTMGALAAGGWVMGGAVAGLWSQGVVAAGWEGAKGVFAVAHGVAFSAAGGADPSPAVAGFFEGHAFYHFTKASARVFMLAAWLGWVMPVALMAGHLWRTRGGAQK